MLLPDYQPLEAKFQLSLRTKIAQDVLLPGGDLWLAFTQQAMWQICNGEDSKPFRNTDYEPEAIFVRADLAKLRTCRSAGNGATRSSVSRTSRTASPTRCRAAGTASTWAPASSAATGGSRRATNRRINEDLATDNNPDLRQLPRPRRVPAELELGAAHRLAAYRTTLRNVKYGALEFEWTYPIYHDQPNGLRWYVQAFRGYGETLTDYNFRQTSIGAGVTFLSF